MSYGAYSSLLVTLLVAAVGVQEVRSQVVSTSFPVEGAASLYYVAEQDAALFKNVDGNQPYMQLGLREPLHVLQRDGSWSRVRTQDGISGYVKTDVLSNVWIRVSKRKQMIYLYHGTELTRKYPADFGYNHFADKVRRGGEDDRDHWRTPEGVFFVAKKNPRSKFYKAFVLNYPTAEDAERGLRDGLISEEEYGAIVRAEEEFDMPPMHTDLGGWIEIHGNGTGGSTNWTQGCVAIRDADIDELWSLVAVGTPVLIE